MFLFGYFCSRNFIGTGAHRVITKLHWHSLDVRCLTFSTEGSQLFYLYFMTSYVRYTQQCTEYLLKMNALSKAVTVTNACVLVALVNLGQPVFISAFFNMFHERTFGDKCHRFLSVICLSDNPNNCLQALSGHIPAPFFLYPADCQWKRPCPFVLFTKLSPITALQKPVFTFLL